MGGEPGANSLKSTRTVDPYQKRTHTDVNNVPAISHIYHIFIYQLPILSKPAIYPLLPDALDLT